VFLHWQEGKNVSQGSEGRLGDAGTLFQRLHKKEEKIARHGVPQGKERGGMELALQGEREQGGELFFFPKGRVKKGEKGRH